MSSANGQQMEIDVLGLFKNAAMLNISGQEQMLKVGERSKEGILLVSADSKGAVIEFGGEQIELDLSSRIGTDFKTPKVTSVSILLNSLGQYRTNGTINGKSVSFLVDTGANIVAINSNTARALGIDASNGQIMTASTASGVVKSRKVNLDSIQIGNIRVSNVQAAIIEGNYPEDILLGMSFLRSVEIKENAGVMQLTGKF